MRAELTDIGHMLNLRPSQCIERLATIQGGRKILWTDGWLTLLADDGSYRHWKP